MAGSVVAVAHYLPDIDGVEVLPRTCPAADIHRRAAEKRYEEEMKKGTNPVVRREWTLLKCTTVDRSGQRLTCPYLYGLAVAGDARKRVDVGALRNTCVAAAVRELNVQSLCTAQRVNRPPGV